MTSIRGVYFVEYRKGGERHQGVLKKRGAGVYGRVILYGYGDIFLLPGYGHGGMTTNDKKEELYW